MSFNHYYQSELSALRHLGTRFAEHNPALAPFLGQSGRDPDVERLLEGFAFLTGRLRQKLDDGIPELTQSLMHLLWPNYMRPLPAFSMLQFDPLSRPGKAVHVPRGTPVESHPVDGVPCQFRTTSAIDVHPLALTAVDFAQQGDGARLAIRAQMTTQGHIGELALSSLRVHLAGERYVAQWLYYAMLAQARALVVILLDESGRPLEDAHGAPLGPTALPLDALTAAGFTEQDALVPYPLNTFRGYRFLQEYFVFQEKFLFVDVNGLSILQQQPSDVLERARGIELRFSLSKVGSQRIRPSLENVRLYCTPVANLFSHDAVPIRLDGRQDRYLVRPAEWEAPKCGVFSVDGVTGWRPGGKGYEAYVPFESFEHDHSSDGSSPRPHYSVRQQAAVTGDGLETYLCFGARSGSGQETLSVELTCTNQDLPRRLRLGDICVPAEGTPEFLNFRNITTPTASYAPPLHKDYLWKLVSNMSLNYLSLANVEALKVILETYDLPRYYDPHAERVSKRLLDGLEAIRHQQADRLYRGLPIRGIRTTLIMNPESYLGEADLYLFASVLNEFFALYASLNSYHELQVKSTHGEVYAWTPRMGQQPLL